MDVLNSRNYDWEKPAMTRTILTAILGEGLVSVEGNVHKAMRRVAAPAFSGRQTRALAPLFYSKGLALIEVLARQVKKADGGVVEITGAISRVTLDIIGAAGVGMDFNALDDEESKLAKLYELVMEPPSFFMLAESLFPRWLLQQFGWKGYSKTIEAQSQLRSEVRALLQEKKAVINEEKSTPHSTDIIASIMKSGDFSDDYLIGQLLTFLAAGHDTTASALVWATWLLSRHPQIQDRLRAECSAKLPNGPVSEVDAAAFDPENMPFLAAVCNETLRLYPPAPSTVREAIVSTTIRNVPIAKGTLVTIPPWAVNRNRALWGANAADFIPDRWIDGPNAANGGAESPYSFLTFLHGPRSCIGQGFARLEMKCLLALLITRFAFETTSPDQMVQICGFITIKPQGGLRLKVYDLKSKER
ncbi:uncharacterized protein A1O9_03408 [Exophiala aquamarina CBS 119918]|uniref:Cytochrome P450 oxidoreductase n=1 Tax=Exophiala aquamarina CBS 119918 TaxID=1182545 RepID=A0A072PQ45_9EURO|nr:uncharacterized protein A1O9_03408 [Exophiala aquamarina CBS 119918]KEF61837.1 hypothetical protein A1O9_03408 [Exophiala aquamarina CBS 119918]